MSWLWQSRFVPLVVRWRERAGRMCGEQNARAARPAVRIAGSQRDGQERLLATTVRAGTYATGLVVGPPTELACGRMQQPSWRGVRSGTVAAP